MLTIHGVPVSVHTRKVLVVARAKGLDFKNEPVIPFSPPPGWDRLSPTGKIPVLVDGGETVADSTVICAYLDEVRPEPPAYPTGSRERIRALWLEEYADGTVYREVVHPLFFQTYIRPRMLQQPTDAAAVQAAHDALPRVFGYLEREVGDGFIVGRRACVADYAVASNLVNFQYLGFELDGDRFPRLAAHFRRTVAQPPMRAALADERATAEAMGLRRGFLDALLD